MRNRKGFTLIEILIAFTLSLIVVLIIFSAMRLSERSYNKVSEREEFSLRLRVVMERVGWLIRGAYPFVVVDEEKNRRVLFRGKSREVGFVTTSTFPLEDNPYDRSGIKWVEIFSDDNGLKIREGIFFKAESDSQAYVIEPSIKEIVLSYLDPEDGAWYQEWDDEKTYLPAAIKLKALFQFEGKDIEIPEMVFRIQSPYPFIKE